MIYGATVNTRKSRKAATMPPALGQSAFAAAVNVVDSVIITRESDPTVVLAQWIAYDPSISFYSELYGAQSVKLFLNWSDQNGAIDLQQGDYFTFVIPDIFDYDYVSDITDGQITNDSGELVATYSIYDNGSNQKEVRITFTDYVNDHSNISGDFWLLLFVGNVYSSGSENVEIIINDTLLAQGDVIVNPGTGGATPRDDKAGFSSPAQSVNGYYIFEWTVFLNMAENPGLGFHSLSNFSFGDELPKNSPHVFLTPALRQELGIDPAAYQARIGEYTGADAAQPENRYQLFFYQYNDSSWYNHLDWHTLANGLTGTGINGGSGLNVTGLTLSDKFFSGNLGNLTRPTVISFFTISTIQITESALGDTQVAALFRNVFSGNYGEDLHAALTVYRFEAGGSAQGIYGDYGFTFNKLDQSNAPLPGAMFALYTSENFAAGASRFVFSDYHGQVAFNNLPPGVYYLLETAAPEGYLPNNNVYRVVLNTTGFEIYYGENFQNRLSEIGYNIINRSEIEVVPVSVSLLAEKNLSGGTLVDGMFSFVVRDAYANIVATGTNDQNGQILFSPLSFDTPGAYIYTVEEAISAFSGIVFDNSSFTVTVNVSADSSGNLSTEIQYPAGGIVFNNSSNGLPVCPEPTPPEKPYCPAPKPHCTCYHRH